MNTIHFSASSTQLRKLRKGQKVNIKRGNDYQLHVSPDTYAKMGKSKGNSASIALDSNELAANKNTTTIPKGKGIFDTITSLLGGGILSDTLSAIGLGVGKKPRKKRVLKGGHLDLDLGMVQNPEFIPHHGGVMKPVCNPTDMNHNVPMLSEKGSVGIGGSLLYQNHPARLQKPDPHFMQKSINPC